MYHTGGTRWSQVTEDRDGGVQVDIPYSLTDAAEAVQQHGEQLVTQRQDTGTTQGGYIGLYLHHDPHTMDVSRLWGDPPRDQLLSAAPWSDLLVKLSEWPHTANTLNVVFDDAHARGVVGFLQSLQMERTQAALRRLLVQHEGGRTWRLWRLLVQDEGGRLRIKVWNGHIDSSSLLAWTDWYLHQVLLQVQLVQLTCEISGSDPATTQQQQARVRSLQHAEHNGRKLFDDLNM